MSKVTEISTTPSGSEIRQTGRNVETLGLRDLCPSSGGNKNNIKLSHLER